MTQINFVSVETIAVDDALLEKAKGVFAENNLTITQGIEIYLRFIDMHGKLPFGVLPTPEG